MAMPAAAERPCSVETVAAAGPGARAEAADLPPQAGFLLGAACVVALAAWVWAALAVWQRGRQGRPIVPPRACEPVPWSAADVAVVFAIYLAGTTLAARLLPPQPALADSLFAGSTASLLATVAAAGWLHVRGATTRSLGLVARRWWEDVGLACGALAFVLAPLLVLAGLLDQIVPYRHPLVDYLRTHHDMHAIGLVAVAAVVAAPLAEEFFFRRVLQGWLERMAPANAWEPVMASSLAFALAHVGQGLAWVPLTLLGLVLGRIAQRTGSIVPCILLHALFNAVSVCLVVVQVSAQSAAG